MAGVVIEVNSAELRRALTQAARRAVNLQPAFSIIGQDLERSVQKNFDAEGRPDRWAPWSPAYSDWRVKHKPGKVLTRDAVLRNSITSKAKRREVTVGTNVVYAAIHQKGGPIVRKRTVRRRKRGMLQRRTYTRRQRRGEMPARPFLIVQPEDRARAVRTIEQYLARPFK